MAVALRFGLVILQSGWAGDAAEYYVASNLNALGEVAEARLL